MKENKLQKILMAACLAVLVLFAGTVVLRFFTRQVLVVGMGMDNGFTRAVFFDHAQLRTVPGSREEGYGDTDDYSYDWASQYPYLQQESQTQAPRQSALSRLLGRYKAMVESLKLRIDNYTQDNLVFYKPITGLAGRVDRLLGWNFAALNEYNGLYRLEDGWWTGLNRRLDTTESQRSLVSFGEFLADQGAELLYVQAPNKVCKEDTLVSGVMDFANQNADQLLSGLTAAGIPTLDLRESLHGQGMDHHEAFFVTDHHWTGETGLWAAGEIGRHLKEHFGCGVDLEALAPERFYAEVYPDHFLGSQGKKLTLSLVAPEDISLLYPSYETRLRFQIPSIGIDLTGDFSVTYNMEAVEGPDPYSRDPYHAYSYGDRALIRYENPAAPEGKKVLLIHDSFADVVQSFLALGLRELETMDVRYFTGSLETYIREHQPDLVIVMYNAAEISGKIDWSSGNNLFDFR